MVLRDSGLYCVASCSCSWRLSWFQTLAEPHVVQTLSSSYALVLGGYGGTTRMCWRWKS
ncbi:Hypothetical protein FKW44_019704 [Caligus rogercresseyi]|uniref:Uncharacterized protein n=1 Tax=Caligus rogercresseyi TaxID=217165 RepID=A0A7T8GW98_CALRO|nr:Hypothetical protein FKW44_019704 [Caligus rogercresseyi]